MCITIYFVTFRYENLMKEERLVTQEMMAMGKRIELWAQLAPAVPSARSVKSATELASARDITKDLPPEVATFEACVIFWRTLITSSQHKDISVQYFFCLI